MVLPLLKRHRNCQSSHPCLHLSDWPRCPRRPRPAGTKPTSQLRQRLRRQSHPLRPHQRALQDHLLLRRLRERLQRRQRSQGTPLFPLSPLFSLPPFPVSPFTLPATNTLLPPSQNPVKQLRRNGFLSLFIVALLYVFANIAYFSAVPKADIRASKQIAASLFFTAVFGSSNAVKGLNFLIALSSFGNLIAVLLGTSRLIRECGRLVLPFYATSTRQHTPSSSSYLSNPPSLPI